MSKLRGSLARRVGPLGTAIVIWDIWKRLPPKQRKLILSQAKKHGPKLVKKHGPKLAGQLFKTRRK